MEAEDLMTGDYVQHKRTKEVIWIFEIDADRNVINNEPDGYCSEKNIFIDDIEPIPLTPEILEKNGFERFFPETWVGGGLMLQRASDCGYRIVVTCDFDDEETNNTPFVILYVHELQHALRLCRIEKEIIL